MEQLAIIGRLKSGVEPRAAALIAEGPPFDPEEHGLTRHTVYLSAADVVFVFEGHEVEWIVDALVDEEFQWPVLAALDKWRPLLEEQPRLARPAYSWPHELVDGTVA
jgi:hypothetical protein